MNVPYYNITEYIILSLGMNVSMPMVWKKNARNIDMPFNERYLQNTCNTLRREKVIRFDNDEKEIYLTTKGLTKLEKLNTDIYNHYNDITSNHTVNGKVKKQSMLRTSKVHQFFEGEEINGIRLVYSENYFNKQKNFDKVNQTLPFGNDTTSEKDRNFMSLIKAGDIRGIYLYSSLLIKKDVEFNFGVNSKTYLSQMKAFLLCQGNPYFIYCDIADETYTSVIEMQLARNLLTVYSQVFGMDEYRKIIKEAPKGNAITLYSDKEKIYTYFFSERDIKLNNIFTRYYIVPCANTESFSESDGKYIIELLKIDNIHEKIKRVLYKEESNGVMDGYVKGVPSWELLTSDFNKIELIKLSQDANVICYEWQKEIVVRLLPNTNLTFNILTNKNKLLELIKKGENQ